MNTRRIFQALCCGAVIACAAGYVCRSPSASEFVRNAVSSHAKASPRPFLTSGHSASLDAQSYRALLTTGKVVQTDARTFDAQSWEPRLAEAVDLPPGQTLRRCSSIVQLSGFKYPLVRVDLVVRSPRRVSDHNAKPQARNAASNETAPPSDQPLSAAAVAPDEEVIWDAAMVADHLMVQTCAGVNEAQLRASLPRGCRVRKAISAQGLYAVEIPSHGGRSIENAVVALNKLTGVVQFAEPDFLLSGADVTPNDTLFGSNTSTQQWHMGKIMAPRAWGVITSPKTPAEEASTVVAVVDTGVDYTHPDLAPNIWSNPGESGGGKETNGIDDDGDGYVDNWRGYDFVDHDNNPMDDVGHGTHVAGIIGAAGNNSLGVSGICWNVKLLPLRIIRKLGTGTYGVYSDAVAALNYLRALNASGRVVAVANHSWGGSGYSLAMLNAINNPLSGDAFARSTFTNGVASIVVTADAVELANIKAGMFISGPGIAANTKINEINGSTLTLSAVTNATFSNVLLSMSDVPAGVTSTFAKGVNQITVNGSASEIARIRSGRTITGTGIPANTQVTIVDGGTLTLSNYTTVARTNQALTFALPTRPRPYGVVHVGAAGNSRFNADRIPTYPAGLPSGYMVSVGASDTADNVAVWTGGAGSNYGRLNVDVYAPGSGIWSTKLKLASEATYGYERRNGTSMAAPQVSGALALLRLWQPDLTELQARQILIDQVDVIPALKDKGMSGGRLNVARMVDRVYQPILVGSGGSTGGAGLITRALETAMAISGKLGGGPGALHMLAVDQGEVWAWGNNGTGQLGDGTQDNSATPVKAAGLSEVMMVAQTVNSSFALKADGTVWSWGGNFEGELGFGSSGSPVVQLLPRRISALSNITWISAGTNHCVAVRADGKVFAWGKNDDGQLGDGTTTTRYTPILVPGLTGVLQAEAGSAHTAALAEDGSVWAWGARDQGFNPIGDGVVTGPALTPVHLAGFGDVVFVEATGHASLYLKADGTVWQAGLIGTSQDASDVPAQKVGLNNIRVISGGLDHALALDADGRLFAWGGGSNGELGSGTSLSGVVMPVESLLPEGSGVLACAATGVSTVVVDLDGRLLSCGSNAASTLGTGTMPDRAFPVEHPMLRGATAIEGAYRMRWARGADGKFLMWGEVNRGELGEQDVTLSWPTEYPVPEPASPIQEMVSPSGRSVLARLADGTVHAWGYSGEGELGIPFVWPETYTSLQQVAGLDQVTDLAAGANFAFAVKSDGSVKAWGRNSSGQLGVGDKVQRNEPTTVVGLSAVSRVCAGNYHALALRTDGTVWAWGDNSSGQLGDGTTVGKSTPIQVSGLANIVQLEAPVVSGFSHLSDASFALKADGTLYGWGQYGDYFGLANTTGQRLVRPTILYKPSATARPIVKVVCRQQSIVALLDNGTLVSWGADADFLGRAPGTPVDFIRGRTALPVFGATNVTDVFSGHTRGNVIFTKSDGSTWCWGHDEFTMGLGEAWSGMLLPVLGFRGASTTLSTLATGSTADSWILQNFSANEVLNNDISADTADLDEDGMANLMEYALGLKPKLANATSVLSARVDLIGATAQSESVGQIALFDVPTVELIDGKHYLVLTVPRADGIRQDIDYIVEVSDDLVTWRSGDPHTVTLLDTAEILEVCSATSLDDVPQQFIRLKVRRKGSDDALAVTSFVVGPDLQQVPQVRFVNASRNVAESAGVITVDVQMQPAAAVPVNVPFTVAGSASAGLGGDLTLGPSPLTFDPGVTINSIVINVLQDTEVETDETLQITLGTPNAPATLGATLVHTLSILDDDVAQPPRFAPQPVSQIVALNSNVSLSAGVATNAPTTTQWRKNGINIAGATGAVFSINKVQFTAAGGYSMKATNAAGSTVSGTAELAVVDTSARTLNLPVGATATLALGATGNGLNFQWLKNGGTVANGATKTLVLKAITLADAGAYTCVVSRGSQILTSGVFTLNVLTGAPEIIEPFVLPDVVIGSAFGPLPLPVNAASHLTPTSYSAIGLPAGITIHPSTGIISGRATVMKSTAYAVTLKATNVKGTDTLDATIKVHAMPPGSVGTFTGWVERDTVVNSDLGGRLDFTTTLAGTFSGTLINGTTSHRITGKLDCAVGSLLPSGTLTILRPNLSDLTLAFTIDSSNNRLIAATVSAGGESADITAWRNVLASTYKGYYTFGLDLASANPVLPQGTGYASFTIAQTGGLVVSGKLPDGVAFTTSTFAGPSGEVLVHQALATTDTVVGQLNIGLDQVITGNLSWSRKQQISSSRTYKDAFGPVNMVAAGARYIAPAGTGAVVMGLTDMGTNNARLEFSGADFGTPVIPLDTDLRIKSIAIAGLPALPVARKLTLIVTPGTGTFSGLMTLSDNDPTKPGFKVSRGVAYQGLIRRRTNGSLVGDGWFLLPDLPALSPLTTITTSPIRSGRVVLRAP